MTSSEKMVERVVDEMPNQILNNLVVSLYLIKLVEREKTNSLKERCQFFWDKLKWLQGQPF